jgi:hypothetical protein
MISTETIRLHLVREIAASREQRGAGLRSMLIEALAVVFPQDVS